MIAPYNEVLWRVPLAGGTPLRLTPTSSTMSGINIDFEITPDSTAIVYHIASYYSSLYQDRYGWE